jgi:hypothetical protein
VTKNTNWLLLVLLIFTGQTLSVPLSNNNDCGMDHSSNINSGQSMTAHEMPDHDMTMMMDMSMMTDMNMDCCADDCQCSDGMCLSTVYLSTLENNIQLFIENRVDFQVVSFKTIQRTSSIYRPPILN